MEVKQEHLVTDTLKESMKVKQVQKANQTQPSKQNWCVAASAYAYAYTLLVQL